MKNVLLGTILSLALACCTQAATVLVEAEGFDNRGGWVVDQQSIDVMGEVLGRAAALCKKHNCDPRDVYRRHLDELKQLLRQSIGKPSTHGG